MLANQCKKAKRQNRIPSFMTAESTRTIIFKLWLIMSLSAVAVSCISLGARSTKRLQKPLVALFSSRDSSNWKPYNPSIDITKPNLRDTSNQAASRSVPSSLSSLSDKKTSNSWQKHPKTFRKPGTTIQYQFC